MGYIQHRMFTAGAHEININPETGIRYGVIDLRNLNPDIALQLHDMARDAYIDDCRATRRADLERAVLAILHAADPILIGDAVAIQLDAEEETGAFETAEPDATLNVEGVKLQYFHLGGAALIMVIDSEYATYAQELCSPCCPNAANLDAGTSDTHVQGFECYTVPPHWLEV